ncbi:MAG TPA: hypothetical protein VFI65_34270 [Streptosporangiaceae bacterium]|nr:hypothetical protein [Streptosporangiaceae bacterium]
MKSERALPRLDWPDWPDWPDRPDRIWELGPLVRATRRVRLVLGPLFRRILASHRRYASGNGDALAGALTYALLVGSAPAVLLGCSALGALRLGPGLAGSNLLGDTHSLLPAEVVAEVDGPGAGAVSLRLSVIALLAWFALRLVRALRTAVRTMYLCCGGTPRVQRPGLAEDLGLVNRAREHSRLVRRAEYMVVGHSLRRVRAWGPRRTLLWYWDRRYQPASASAMNVR